MSETKETQVSTATQLEMSETKETQVSTATQLEMSETKETQVSTASSMLTSPLQMYRQEMEKRYRLHCNIHVEPQQPSQLEMSETKHPNIMTLRQLQMKERAEMSRPPHMEDRIGDIADWDRKISQTEGAYSKINNTIKFFSSFYGIMQVGILTAVFSSQQRKGLCKDSWGLLLLSAIVSGGVLIAFLWKYCQQFLLLRRGRRLIQERNSVVGHSSGISTVGLKEEDDLDINRNYWSWITERAAIVVTFTIFSIYLWLSCKSRLLC